MTRQTGMRRLAVLACIGLCAGLGAQEPDWTVIRAELIKELAQWLDKGELISVSSDYDPGGRWARENLTKFGKPAIPALRAALFRDSNAAQGSACQALADLGAREALGDLKTRLSEAPNAYDRIRFLSAIARIDGEGSFDYVLQNLDFSHESFMLRPIAETRSARAIPTLIQMLGNDRTYDEAISGFLKLGPPGIEVLSRKLARKEISVEKIVRAISYAASPETTGLLLTCLESDECTDFWGTWISDPAYPAALRKMVQSRSDKVRAFAAKNLEAHVRPSDLPWIATLISEALRAKPSPEGARYLLTLGELVLAASPKDGQSLAIPIVERCLSLTDERFGLQHLVSRMVENPQPSIKPLLFRLANLDSEVGLIQFDDTLEESACRGLARMGEGSKLLRLWKSREINDRAFARGIWELDPEKSFDILVTLTKSASEEIQHSVIWALSLCNDRRAEPLHRSYKPDPKLWVYAIGGLARRGDAETLRALAPDEPIFLNPGVLEKFDESLLLELIKKGYGWSNKAIVMELLRRGSPPARQAATNLLVNLTDDELESGGEGFTLSKGTPDPDAIYRSLIGAKSMRLRVEAYWHFNPQRRIPAPETDQVVN